MLKEIQSLLNANGQLELVEIGRFGKRVEMTSKKHKPWHRRLAESWRHNPITYCEVRFNGCYGTYGLAPAHSKDRRDIHTEDEFREVVAACAKCHWILDREISKASRLQIVKNLIQNRQTV